MRDLNKLSKWNSKSLSILLVSFHFVPLSLNPIISLKKKKKQHTNLGLKWLHCTKKIFGCQANFFFKKLLLQSIMICERMDNEKYYSGFPTKLSITPQTFKCIIITSNNHTYKNLGNFFSHDSINQYL